MKKIALTEATEAQLREFAATTLGIAIPANAKPDTVLAKVKAAWDKPEIMVADEAPHAALEGAAPPPATAKQAPPKRDMVRLIIQRTEDAGGDEPVPVGVNGKVMLVPRGEPVEIPRPYFEVLKNCVTYRYESLKDGGINPEPRMVPLYPWQLVA